MSGDVLDPIWIPCEGSGYPGCLFRMCAMCGGAFDEDAQGRIVAHERQDIIAMVARGDFG
jgi:hypothetical protein